MSDDRPTYLPTEAPAVIQGPLELQLNELVIDALNEYRQVRHAFMVATRGGRSEPDAQERTAYEVATAGLASYLHYQVRRQLGEPSEWADRDETPAE
ncbi:hypothetical protein [Pseudomonas chlororaphis]|uniref:hypothetical protein n=1 Tax=Pseudomonas chlororaphis TaxID=587753 RepID=UPI002D78B109|nr:hypothetical protein [Pseudomonas chlororaphis]